MTTSATTTRTRISTRRSEAVQVALALGGNVPGTDGPVERTLNLALRRLEEVLGPLRVASLYRTAAVSPVPQPDYLNTAVLANASLEPGELLALAKALEMAAGRRRGERFGPRPLDIDLLLYGDLQSSAPELTLPHPRLRERRFVLEPLAEIAPDLQIPPDNAKVSALLARLQPEPLVLRVGSLDYGKGP